MKETSFRIYLENLFDIDLNISVIIKGYKLEEIKNKIILKYKSLRKFSKELNCSPSFLSSILKKDGKSCKFILFKKISKELELNTNEYIEKIISRCRPNCFIKSENLPIMGSPFLSSLVGRSFGDGCIGPISFNYTNKNMELIADTTRKVMMLPIENVNLNKRYYKAISVQYAKLVRNILVASGAPVGRKTSQQLYVPPWIKNDSFEIKASFIQALFDDEATVSVSSRQIVLGMWKRSDIIDNLTNFFSEIKSILNEFGINGITITDGNECVHKDGIVTKEKRLRICGIANFEKFKEKVGFFSSRKNELLNEVIQSTQKSLLKKYSSKIKIIELLKTKGQLNTSELAKEIGKSRRITCDNLRDLENLGKVSRIRSQNKTKSDTWFLTNTSSSNNSLITGKFFYQPDKNQSYC